MLWHPSRVCFVEPRSFSATNDHGRLLGRLYCEDRYHGRSMLQLCEIDISNRSKLVDLVVWITVSSLFCFYFVRSKEL